MKWRVEDMDRKYLTKDLDVMLKIIRSYSENTAEKATDIINTEQRLIKVEQILKTNPTEQEFLNELNKLEK